jgi:hypothetical protein
MRSSSSLGGRYADVRWKEQKDRASVGMSMEEPDVFFNFEYRES